MSIAEKLQTIAENQQAVYDAGYDQSESNFWDQMQNFGNRTQYIHGFREWGGEYIRPKYVVHPVVTSLNSMFRDATRLKILETKYFDLSNAMTSPTNAANGNQRVFQGCTALETIENIGLPASYYDATFKDCPLLKTIAQLRFSQTGAGTRVSNNCFENDTSLENINDIVGVIEVSINFQWCPLTAATAKKIINHLENYAGTASEGTCTVTFSETTWGYLDAEGTASPSGTTWREYIDEIGWGH